MAWTKPSLNQSKAGIKKCYICIGAEYNRGKRNKEGKCRQLLTPRTTTHPFRDQATHCDWGRWWRRHWGREVPSEPSQFVPPTLVGVPPVVSPAPSPSPLSPPPPALAESADWMLASLTTCRVLRKKTDTWIKQLTLAKKESRKVKEKSKVLTNWTCYRWPRAIRIPTANSHTKVLKFL